MKRKGEPSSSFPPTSSSSFVELVESEVGKNRSERPNTRSWVKGDQRRVGISDKEELCGGCSWKKQHFFKVLIGDFHERLMLPPAFLKHLTVEESGAAVVEDRTNRCWAIELLRRGNGMMFSKGWKRFVEENDLETGDFLVFQYDGELHFTVTIFDKSSCEKIPEKRCPRIKERDAASSFETTNPSFKRVMRRCTYQMHIPRGFPEANLPSEACWVTLENSVGRQWPVRYTKTKRSINGRSCLQRKLSAGWCRFSACNRLRKGNVLVFELVGGNNVFKVHIF